MMRFTDAACGAALQVWFEDSFPELRRRMSHSPALISLMKRALAAAHDREMLCMEGSVVTQITDDELLRMRDLLRHYKTFDDEGGDLCFEVENKILEGEDCLLSICDELLMLRASVRLQAGAPGARQEFFAMAPHIKLPLHISDASGGGWIVDSAGEDVAFVNDDGPAKEHADGVVAMIVLAVNTCAGFRVEAGG